MSVPQLRFKEFDGNWSLSSLNQLSTKIGDGIHATPKYDEAGEIPFINGNNLIDGSVVINENTKCISAEEFQKYNQILSDRTLFLSINGTIGNLAFYKNEKVLLGKSVCFINLKNDIDKKFIYLLLQSPQLAKTFNSELTGTTIKNLSLATVRNSEFYCPREGEQTKIASFLSAVDEKISQLTQKHELLSHYKQGMMQKLFSQQIRFKSDDGSEFGEWEEVRLGDLVDLISGFAFKSDYFTEEGQKLITPKNFTTSGKASFTHINTKWTTEEADKKFLCSPNDLLVLLTDLTQSCELLGKPILLNECDGNVLLNQRIVKVISNAKIEKSFLLYLLLTDSYHELIVSTASGTTVKHSSNKVIQSFEFLLPCLEEQTKIANFLSTIDQKIEVVAQQIEQAKIWKKGLLQQMFV